MGFAADVYFSARGQIEEMLIKEKQTKNSENEAASAEGAYSFLNLC